MNRPANGLLKHSFFNYVIMISTVCLIAGCSGNPSKTEDYGSLAISIKLMDKDDPESDNITTTLTKALSQDDKVYVSVFDSEGKLLVKGGPFDWGDGRGTVEKVPAGTGRTITVEVYDSNLSMLYSGSLYNKSIQAGTNSFINEPIVVSAVIDITPACEEDYSGSWYIEIYDYAYCDSSSYGPYYGTYRISQIGCSVTIQFIMNDSSTGTLTGTVEDGILMIDDVPAISGVESYSFTNWYLELFGDTVEGSVDWELYDEFGYALCSGTSDFNGMK